MLRVGMKKMTEKTKCFVFLDLETTGFPWCENNKTKITELAMVAVSRKNILHNHLNGVPRVLHKLTLCFDPERPIHYQATMATDLSNLMLEGEGTFDENSAELINLFMKRLEPPVCVIAHNGFKFDFSILNTHFFNTGINLIEDVFCIDSLPMFKDIMENDFKVNTDETDLSIDVNETQNEENADIECTPTCSTSNHDSDFPSDEEFTKFVKSFDESQYYQNLDMVTPQKQNISKPSSSGTRSIKAGVKRKMKEKSPRVSLKLGNIYERLIGHPAEDVHRAEGDCMLLLESCASRAKEFVDWCDNNRVLLKDIECMKVGEKFPHFTPDRSRVKRSLFQ